MTLEIVASEPWEFFDENGGDVVFPCVILERHGDRLVLALQRNAKMYGRDWPFAIVNPRFAGQHLSDQPASPEPANIHFVNAVPSDVEQWAKERPAAGTKMPWAIGSLRPQNN